ncbi:MAG: bifunctional nuclease family protein [Thermotogae bacterium]|nr:bifunctional nuclease family protein [Thermotogota bacterium]
MTLLLGVFLQVSNVDVFSNYLLLAADGKVLVMLIGESEAFSIGLALRGIRFSRPLTHDLMIRMMEIANIKPEKVEIYAVKDGAYLARMYFTKQHFLWFKQRVVLDSRPSDAVALALKLGIPIYVADTLMRTPEELFRMEGDSLRIPPGGIEG